MFYTNVMIIIGTDGYAVIDSDYTGNYRSNRPFLRSLLSTYFSGNRVEKRDVIPRFFQLAQPYRVKLPIHNRTFSTAV